MESEELRGPQESERGEETTGNYKKEEKINRTLVEKMEHTGICS